MKKVLLVFACAFSTVFAAARSCEERGLRGSRSLEPKAVASSDDRQKEKQVNGKIIYVAALIDAQHMEFTRYLKTEKNIILPKSLAEIESMFKKQTTLVLSNASSEIQLLVKMSSYSSAVKKKSEEEVASHFAVDHMVPMLKVLFDKPPDEPRVTQLASKLPKFAE